MDFAEYFRVDKPLRQARADYRVLWNLDHTQGAENHGFSRNNFDC